jgi:hypothetical protein
MVTVASAVAIASSLGCVTYTMLYFAFVAHNTHMGFKGDFEAAAASCGKLALFFAVVAGGAAASGFVRCAGRMRRKAKVFYDEPDAYSEAVLPGSYSGLRKR